VSSDFAMNKGISPSGVEVSRTGAEVLISGNLATASLVNPEREADQWAEVQLKRILATRAGETIVVIGVGSGFHLRALQMLLDEIKIKRPIVAIDTCEESIQFASKRTANVTFVCVRADMGIESFLAIPEVARWIVQTFTLLKHKPTIARVGTSLRKIEMYIIGRTPEAFSAQLKMRPQIAAGLNPGRARRIADTSLVSIRDLSKMWDISSELKPDRRLFRVLEELVK
jgi:hypothetical protein